MQHIKEIKKIKAHVRTRARTHTHTHTQSSQLMQKKRLRKYILIFFTFITFEGRERQNTSHGGIERKGDTESEPGSRL